MKTFVSIGCGVGIGLATAERFAREGYRTILVSRTLANVERLANELDGKGYTAIARAADASDPASLAALFKSVTDEFGPIDAVHYNAASLRMSGWADQPIDAINQDLAINVGGALATVCAVAPGMAERGGGSILITGGGFALYPAPDLLTLSMGKAALRNMVTAIAPDLETKGVHLATVTVCCYVQPDTALQIGDLFWELHQEPKGSWCPDIMFNP